MSVRNYIINGHFISTYWTLVSIGEREGGREGGRGGGREGGRERGREKGMEREGGREGERGGGRERGTDGRREGWREGRRGNKVNSSTNQALLSSNPLINTTTTESMTTAGQCSPLH